MTARIKPLSPPYEEETGELLKSMMPPGIDPIALFRTMAVNKRVAKKIQAGNLLDKGSITLKERETIILKTCALCKGEYEWGVHVAFFKGKAGFTDEQIKDTLHEEIDESLWDANQVVLLKLVDELHRYSTISEYVWTVLSGYYQDEQIIEMIALTGFYHTISFLVNGLQIDLEKMRPRFQDFTSSNSYIFAPKP